MTMPPFEEDEIVEGAQPFLNEKILRESGTCRTNAKIVGGYDTSQDKDRNYQVLHVDRDRKVCVVAPVIKASNPGSMHIRLETGERKCFPGKSKTAPLYLFEEQAVEIPFDVLIKATTGEKSRRGARRAYAPGKPDIHERIRSRFQRDDGPFGTMRPLVPVNRSDEADD